MSLSVIIKHLNTKNMFRVFGATNGLGCGREKATHAVLGLSIGSTLNSAIHVLQTQQLCTGCRHGAAM